MGIWRTKPIEAMINNKDKNSGLAKTMGPFDLTALGIGAIIGTGIFVLTGVAAAKYAGPGVVLSFIISGIAAALAALVYAELASMVPVAGSAYTYSYASLGELVAWLIGWNLILEYMVAAGAVAIGWGSYFSDFLKSFSINLPATFTKSLFEGGIINLPAIMITLLITWLAVRGTKESTSLNKIIVTVKILVIILFIALASTHVKPVNWQPFLPFGISGVVQGAAIIFFAYIGFDAVSTAAEEVKNPSRDLPIAIIGSLIISTILYIIVSLILTGIVPYPRLNTASPVTTALLAIGFRFASGLVSIGALAGLTSVLLVTTFAQSRIFFAMSRDGLLPPIFHKIHPKYKTPYINNLLIGLLVALIAAFLPITIVAELANIGTLSAFIVVSIGVIILRKKRPDLKRPFRTPLMPYLPIMAILSAAFLVINLPRLTLIRFVVWVAIGTVIYFAYSKKHSILNQNEKPPNKATEINSPYFAAIGLNNEEKKGNKEKD